ncbi:MAG: DUF6887 family protein [Waterburya sp.]
MTTRELTIYLLENRKDKEAYIELRKREGKKIIIPANASVEEQNQILKQITR